MFLSGDDVQSLAGDCVICQQLKRASENKQHVVFSLDLEVPRLPLFFPKLLQYIHFADTES